MGTLGGHICFFFRRVSIPLLRGRSYVRFVSGALKSMTYVWVLGSILGQNRHTKAHYRTVRHIFGHTSYDGECAG